MPYVGCKILHAKYVCYLSLKGAFEQCSRRSKPADTCIRTHISGTYFWRWKKQELPASRVLPLHLLASLRPLPAAQELCIQPVLALPTRKHFPPPWEAPRPQRFCLSPAAHLLNVNPLAQTCLQPGEQLVTAESMELKGQYYLHSGEERGVGTACMKVENAGPAARALPELRCGVVIQYLRI